MCLPGGSVRVVSVCPLPKWTTLSLAGSGAVEIQVAEVAVDEQMMVAGVVELYSRRRHTHAFQPESHDDRARARSPPFLGEMM